MSDLDLTPFTLDPPGRIAVVGAGPLGVETALYGRFLGYDINVYESRGVASSLLSTEDRELPLLPDRSLSNLAVQALLTQTETTSLTFPVTLHEWANKHLIQLTETDLLQGRIHVDCEIRSIETCPVEDDEEEIPPDFQLSFVDSNGSTKKETHECVIVATGSEVGFEMPEPDAMPYLFRVGGTGYENWEESLQAGLREIVGIFAGLGGRPDLDLYRPRRV